MSLGPARGNCFSRNFFFFLGSGFRLTDRFTLCILCNSKVFKSCAHRSTIFRTYPRFDDVKASTDKDGAWEFLSDATTVFGMITEGQQNFFLAFFTCTNFFLYQNSKCRLNHKHINPGKVHTAHQRLPEKSHWYPVTADFLVFFFIVLLRAGVAFTAGVAATPASQHSSVNENWCKD